MKIVLRLAMVLSLCPAAAWAGEAAPVELRALPPSAVVMTLSPGLTNVHPLALGLTEPAPIVKIAEGPETLMMPRTLKEGARAVAVAKSGLITRNVPISREMAVAIQDSLAKGDIASVYGILGREFDRSAAGAQADGPAVGTPAAVRSPALGPAQEARPQAKDPPAPLAIQKPAPLSRVAKILLVAVVIGSLTLLPALILSRNYQSKPQQEEVPPAPENFPWL